MRMSMYFVLGYSDAIAEWQFAICERQKSSGHRNRSRVLLEGSSLEKFAVSAVPSSVGSAVTGRLETWRRKESDIFKHSVSLSPQHGAICLLLSSWGPLSWFKVQSVPVNSRGRSWYGLCSPGSLRHVVCLMDTDSSRSGGLTVLPSLCAECLEFLEASDSWSPKALSRPAEG